MYCKPKFNVFKVFKNILTFKTPVVLRVLTCDQTELWVRSDLGLHSRHPKDRKCGPVIRLNFECGLILAFTQPYYKSASKRVSQVVMKNDLVSFPSWFDYLVISPSLYCIMSHIVSFFLFLIGNYRLTFFSTV